MTSTFTAEMTSPGAPDVPTYSATVINVVPNAPPLLTQVIQSNNDENRHLGLSFKNDGLDSGSHVLTDDNTSVIYSINSETIFPGISSGNIEIDSLAGTYKGNFTATWTDRFGRQWTVDSNFDIKVIPQK
ncbi:MAG TPA: hypothetical protein VNV36_08795 [Pseudomonas sp.]|uniref:hypothetical protein n=1 Tax=Pseudomonas sp. TaxID=306 RepID=UPI002BCAD0D7|nr:hypothetical protein [Pseudomonas sp.]HWH86856.1 hypothetical protein [Pseudomonas sp.]